MTADMLRNEEQCFAFPTLLRGKLEREVRIVLCPETRRSADMVGDFVTIENAGVEDGGGGDIGKIF
jgi:hypothetical protein